MPAASMPDSSSEATGPSDPVSGDRGATELGSSEIFEASSGLASLSQELATRGERSPNPLDNSGNGRPSFSAVSTLPDAIPLTDPSSKYNELAEEADIAVQELGLIAVRKRALVSQAATAGESPEKVEGRKGDEYRELLHREGKLGARLKEIMSEQAPTEPAVNT